MRKRAEPLGCRSANFPLGDGGEWRSQQPSQADKLPLGGSGSGDVHTSEDVRLGGDGAEVLQVPAPRF